MAARGARAATDARDRVLRRVHAINRQAKNRRPCAATPRARWIEGRTVAIEYRWADGRTERFAQIAAELARLKVDVVVTAGAGPVSAVKQATSLIPIVFAIASDPVGTGLVANLARPGGNVTGLSYLGPDLAAKRLELAREVFSGLARLAIMANNGAAGAMVEMRETQTAATKLGLEVVTVEIQREDQIAPAFVALKDRADALYVVADPLVNANRIRIVTLAATEVVLEGSP